MSVFIATFAAALSLLRSATDAASLAIFAASLAVASTDAAATVSGSAYGLAFLNGLINSAATVSGNAVDVRAMNAIILCNADVISDLSVSSSSIAIINNSASLNANLKKVGDEWITSQPVSTTWFIQ